MYARQVPEPASASPAPFAGSGRRLDEAAEAAPAPAEGPTIEVPSGPHCRFTPPRIRLIPCPLTYSVPLFLISKRRSRCLLAFWAALSLYTTAHPLDTIPANIFGVSVSDLKTGVRPVGPRCASPSGPTASRSTARSPSRSRRRRRCEKDAEVSSVHPLFHTKLG